MISTSPTPRPSRRRPRIDGVTDAYRPDPKRARVPISASISSADLGPDLTWLLDAARVPGRLVSDRRPAAAAQPRLMGQDRAATCCRPIPRPGCWSCRRQASQSSRSSGSASCQYLPAASSPPPAVDQDRMARPDARSVLTLVQVSPSRRAPAPGVPARAARVKSSTATIPLPPPASEITTPT